MKEVLLSVGIDIGTSTTQIIFSNITIEDMSSGFSVPRIEIIDKEIVYRSEIYFTPLRSATEIDMPAVREIVEREYRRAGVKKEEIKTGAVVITGETARKRNANEVLLHLSEFAGDFVVATAGPDLESIIAGRGAGADCFSRQHHTTAANYDIGGGTSNFAMFRSGELVSTGCLDIGGRLVKVEPQTRRITYIAPKIEALLKTMGTDLKVGDIADVKVLKELAAKMCQLLEMSLGVRVKSDFYARILTEEGKDIQLPVPLKHLCFSGGVADYIYSEQMPENLFLYGDIGILLGQAVRQSANLSTYKRFQSNETIRATVVGAGSHITEISGSTIEYDPALLPLKNLPILKLLPEEESARTMGEAIRKKLDWFRLDGELQPVAVAFHGPVSPSFTQVGQMADALLAGMEPLLQQGMPLVTICQNDLAKVLGQTIRAKISGNKGFVCIDAIQVSQGDYIDIGAPAAGGSVLPVVIKTLLFK